MTQGERIKAIRKELDMTLEEFGMRLGAKKSSMSNLENDRFNLTEQMRKSICREFNVNYDWLTTGEGEMFSLPEDEEAAYISELLSDVDNPVYDLIKSIMKTYLECGEKEKMILKAFANDLKKNIKKENQD